VTDQQHDRRGGFGDLREDAGVKKQAQLLLAKALYYSLHPHILDQIGNCEEPLTHQKPIDAGFNLLKHTEKGRQIRGGTIHWHLIDLGGVELLDVAQQANVLVLDKVDGNTLAAKTTRTANAMDVRFTVDGQVIVDDQRHLLHINTTGKNVGGDKHAPARSRSVQRSSPYLAKCILLAGAERLHNLLALVLRHVTVDGRHGKVELTHLLGQEVDLKVQARSAKRLHSLAKQLGDRSREETRTFFFVLQKMTA
jgi:hypothetical protein